MKRARSDVGLFLLVGDNVGGMDYIQFSYFS